MCVSLERYSLEIAEEVPKIWASIESWVRFY